MSLIGNDLITLEEYAIDRAQRQLSWCDEPIQLNRKTFDLLLYLVDHADRMAAKEDLLGRLWPKSFFEESNLTQHIFLLRKALFRHEFGAKIIEPLPGRDYRFVAAIKVESSPATDQTVISASESITRITLEENEVGFPAPTSQSGISHSCLPALPPRRRVL